MRALLWLLTLAALAVGLSLAARYNEGYVLVVLPPWRMEISLNLLLVTLVAGFLLLYLVLRLVIHTLRLPKAVRDFRARREREKAERALQDGARMYFEGRYGHALKSAALAFDSGHGKGLAAILGLRSAHALRDAPREQEWRDRAKAADAEIRHARLMGEAELALEARRFEEAIQLLDELAATAGRHIAALRLSMRACQGAGRWDEALRIVRQLEKHGALTADQAAPLKLRAHRGILQSRRQDGPGLRQYWQKIPAAERRDPRLILDAAQALGEAGECVAAGDLIGEALDDAWDSALVALYAECEESDALGRIARAERWLADHPRDARLLFALGRLCQRRQLWGKAQSYLEASLAVEPSREAHLELARLMDRLDKPADAARHFRAAAESA
ncbi:MAG: heme biosynthesis protein HemY [Rhodocyclaceae bacterium]|nr:heme biosynthesis protein HemY [Rhodocyclaceae bacterium]